jgi:hypothetical protein
MAHRRGSQSAEPSASMSRCALFLRLLAVSFLVLMTRPALAEDYFIDSRGRRVAFAPLYEGTFGGRRYPPQYVRAIAENVGLLAFETFIYWYDPSVNSVDWEYPDLATKVTKNARIRFDDNMPRTNLVLHPVAGSMHYTFTRANGFGVLPSFGAAALSSALWEGLLEWRELTSINDLVVTPIAGTAMGEFFHQLGNYLNSEPKRPKKLDEVVGVEPFGRRMAAMTLGLPRLMHNELDEPAPPPEVTRDRLGLSSAYGHDFRLSLGVDRIANDRGELGSVFVVRTSGEVVAMPGFLRPGEFSTGFGAGNFTSMNLRIAHGSRIRDFDLGFDSHLFGHYWQRFERRRSGLFGRALEIAGRTGLHYVDRSLLERRDQYGIVHLPSPVATYWLALGRTMLRFSGDAAADFAQVRSLAYPAWVDRFGDEGTKSSLLRHGYYNAWGASGGLGAELTARGFVMGTKARYGRYESIDGAERYKEDVTREVHASDDIVELEVDTGYDVPGSVVSTRLSAAHFGRRSRMAPVSRGRYDQRLGVSMGIRF